MGWAKTRPRLLMRNIHIHIVSALPLCIGPVKHYHTCITYTIGTSRFLTKLRILESKNKLALVHKPPLLQPPPLFDVCAWNDEEEWVVDEKLAMSFELSNWMKDYAYDLKATTYLISYSWKNALSIVPTYYIVLWRSSKILTEQEYLPIYRGSSHKTVKQGRYLLLRQNCYMCLCYVMISIL